jgi:hypothetical protein
MENTIAKGTLVGSSGYQDAVKVQLRQGEVFTASVDVEELLVVFPYPGQVSSLSVTGPTGALITSQNTSGSKALDPVSGQPTNDSSVIFTAPATGTYTVTVGTNPSRLQYPPSEYTINIYTLALRPIELQPQTIDPAASPANAALVSYTGGGLYAWLNSSHTALTLSGPTGIGFQIGGNWSETTTPVLGNAAWSTTQFIDSGYVSVSLFSATIPVSLPSGCTISVQTQANGYGGAFGQVTGTALTVDGFPVSTLLSGLLNPLASQYGVQNLNIPGLSISTPGLALGIDLGGAPGPQATGLPLDPAVPYIYLTASTGMSLNYGNISISPSAVPSYQVGVAIDPADPTFGIDVQGVPILNEVGLEFSQNAMIPYTPTAPPAGILGGLFPFLPTAPPVGFPGGLYGDVYFNGKVDLSQLSDDMVPATVQAAVVANLDPAHQGLTNTMSQGFANLAAGNVSSSQALNYLKTISLGVNAQLSLSLSAGQFSVSLPAYAGSLIDYNQNLYINVNNVNPLAGTPLANVFSITSSVDGKVNLAASPPTWAFEAYATTNFLGSTLTGTVEISSAKGLVVDVSQHSSGGFSVPQIGLGLSYSEDFDLTVGIDTSGNAYYQVNADLSGWYEIAGYTTNFNDPYTSSGQVNLGQLVQTLESGALSVWNEIEKVINWLEKL